MNSFKVGDRIVVHRLDENAGYGLTRYLGEVSVIYAISDGRYPYFIAEDISFSDYEIISEEVYNSPLYKALL
jgi:hypothetical protein